MQQSLTIVISNSFEWFASNSIQIKILLCRVLVFCFGFVLVNSEFRMIISFIRIVFFISNEFNVCTSTENEKEKERQSQNERRIKTGRICLFCYVLCYFRINCLVVKPNTRTLVCVCVCTWVTATAALLLLLFMQP